jgi:putative SOS response-associated peptidase YedK
MGGAPLRSCTIITCTANALLAPLHDRMPVILGPENWSAWLGEEPVKLDALLALLKPFPAERLTLWKVASAVGNIRNENAKLIEPLKA